MKFVFRAENCKRDAPGQYCITDHRLASGNSQIVPARTRTKRSLFDR